MIGLIRNKTEQILTSGPRLRSKGCEIEAPASRDASPLMAVVAKPLRSITGRGRPRGGSMTCTGLPSNSGKRLRSDSWRCCSESKLSRKAGMSSSPDSRQFPPML